MRSRRRRFWITVLATGAVAAAVLTGPAQADLVGSGRVTRLPSGNLQSSPDAVYEPNSVRIDIFAKGTDNQIWQIINFNGSFPPSWGPLGPTLAGGVQGDPTVVSWEEGRVDIFVRGPDNKLWQSTVVNAGGAGAFQAWHRPVGAEGTLNSSPEATVRGPGRLDVFVVGTDGNVYQRFWESISWNSEWIFHGRPSGATIVGDPAAVWSGPNRLDIFVRGSDDKLWQRTWNGVGWTDWARPVGTLGTLASSPEATAYDQRGVSGNIAVFVRGTDGGLWGIDFTPAGWGNWVRFGQPGDVFQGTPGATSRPGGRLEIFVRGTDNQAYWYSFQLSPP